MFLFSPKMVFWRIKKLCKVHEPHRPVAKHRVLSIQQKILVWNFGNFTCPVERYILCAQTWSKPPRVWLLFFISRIQKSTTGDNNFVKWRGTFPSNRPKWSDRSKWTTLKAGPKYSCGTKPKWSIPFDVPTEISGILGWMESAYTLHFHPCSRTCVWSPVHLFLAYAIMGCFAV